MLIYTESFILRLFDLVDIYRLSAHFSFREPILDYIWIAIEKVWDSLCFYTVFSFRRF